MKKSNLLHPHDWYQAMMTGISYMVPVIVAGGIIMAIPNAWTSGQASSAAEGTLAYIMYTYGHGLFGLMYYILGVYTAFSIAGRAGIVPGLLAGYFGTIGASGFLGAVVGGIIAGYVAKLLVDKLKLPSYMASVKPILFIPLISALVMLFAMYFIVEPVCG